MTEDARTDRPPSNKAGWIVAGLAGIGIGAGAVMLLGQGDVAPGDRAATEAIVRDYLLANPEIIPQAMDNLAGKQAGAAIAANRAAFETPFASAWAGAEQGDVVLVEFFDYACGFCRRSNPDVARLLAEDKGLKVVWRELPVLGPDSQTAAEVSLAAAKSGRFKAFHDMLFESGRPTAANVAAAARAVGVTGRASPAEVQAEIEKNVGLARAVGASGTPTFVVGDQVLQGAVGYDALKEAITAARAR